MINIIYIGKRIVIHNEKTPLLATSYVIMCTAGDVKTLKLELKSPIEISQEDPIKWLQNKQMERL